MRHVLSWLLTVILVSFLAIVVAMVLLPRFSSWRFDAVLSGSMEPVLNVGGVVVVKPVQPSDISAGDIISFHSGETLITHRVTDAVSNRGELYFVTKGDANEEPDILPVPAENVVGNVIFDAPYLGYLSAFVKTRLGLILTIFLPGALIIALELRSMWHIVFRRDKPETA